MTDRSPEDEALMTQLVAGALSGFGAAVADNKISPEKSAHKAVVMAESAMNEMRGKGLGALNEQKMMVFEKGPVALSSSITHLATRLVRWLRTRMRSISA